MRPVGAATGHVSGGDAMVTKKGHDMNPDEYDVFLSYNGDDETAVEELARRLRDEGLRVFFAPWHLVPGEPWQEALEEALDRSLSCTVFLGPKGLGPWHNEEMRSALQTAVEAPSFRVIPVLLPGADPTDANTLPRFLLRRTWVDFRPGLEDVAAFHRLCCGVLGTLPGDVGGAVEIDPDAILPVHFQQPPNVRPLEPEGAPIMSLELSPLKFSATGIALASGLETFLSALNPLGAIAQTVGEIMACRVEIRRIQTEAEQIRLEYEAQNRRVGATLLVAMTSLEQRRIAMERFFDHAERQMRQHHIWSNQRIRVIQSMTQLITQRDASFAEKQLAHETLRAMSSDLVAAQEAGSSTLTVLVEATRQDLLAVPSLRGLLPPPH